MTETPTTSPRTAPVAQIIAIGMLAWALVPDNPYGYYLLLRWVICGVCTYLALQASEKNATGWVWMLAIVAIVYNPIFRVHLTREFWSVVNIATIVVLAMTMLSNWPDGAEKENRH